MSRYQGTIEERRALGAYIKLMRAAESVTARVHSHLQPVGLSLSQFGVLEALLHLGPMSQVALTRKLLKTGGNITMVVDNLEKRGLVRRERNREDRRYYSVHLTDEGRRLVSDFFPSHATRILEEMRVLSPAEQEELARLCKKLGLQQSDI